MVTKGSVGEQAWFPSQATIKIERKGEYTSNTITTEVTNFEDGGGAKNTEIIAHFGNAFVTVEKPQEKYEVSFDVSVIDTTWDQVISDDVTTVLGSATTNGSTIVVQSGGDQDPFKVKLEWKDNAGSDALAIIYYNAVGVTFERNSPADDRLTGTISFEVAPTDQTGSGQKFTIETSALYDSIAGSPTGSYSTIESGFDGSFGYGVGSML